jgi:hypothetical protein
MSDKRPFRIWNARAKRDERGAYAYERNALNAALVHARWAAPGAAYEVHDTRNGQLLGQFARTATGLRVVDLTNTLEKAI